MHSEKWDKLLELLREQQNLLVRVDKAQTRKEMKDAYEAFSQHLTKLDGLISQMPFDELEDEKQEQILKSLRELRLVSTYANA